jgi:hypothetical protein
MAHELFFEDRDTTWRARRVLTRICVRFNPSFLVPRGGRTLFFNEKLTPPLSSSSNELHLHQSFNSISGSRKGRGIVPCGVATHGACLQGRWIIVGPAGLGAVIDGVIYEWQYSNKRLISAGAQLPWKYIKVVFVDAAVGRQGAEL